MRSRHLLDDDDEAQERAVAELLGVDVGKHLADCRRRLVVGVREFALSQLVEDDRGDVASPLDSARLAVADRPAYDPAREAESATVRLRHWRTRVVLAAVAAGIPQRKIALVVGLSQPQVAKIRRRHSRPV